MKGKLCVTEWDQGSSVARLSLTVRLYSLIMILNVGARHHKIGPIGRSAQDSWHTLSKAQYISITITLQVKPLCNFISITSYKVRDID